MSIGQWVFICLLGGALLGAGLFGVAADPVNYSLVGALVGAIGGLIFGGVVTMVVFGTHVERPVGIAVLGVLIAIALPAWQDYRDRAQAKRLPTQREAPLANVEGAARAWAVAYDPKDGRILISLDARDPRAGRIRLDPTVASGTLNWTCHPLEIEAKRLPIHCRPAKP